MDRPIDEIKRHEREINFIKGSYKTKPPMLKIKEAKWIYLIRSVMRSKNTLIIGPTGSGKTYTAQSIASAVNSFEKRPFFSFNMGSTQDPRSALIGNTYFRKETGTLFKESDFIKAIKSPNAIILLDEISRAHHEAWNIILPVIDDTQRFLRMEEAEKDAMVEVAKGVTFLATANIGNEYTSTRVMDRALLDRFIKVEMDVLSQEEETKLLSELYPYLGTDIIGDITEITSHTRMMVKQDNSKLSNFLSTRLAIEMAGLAYDGFSLAEIAEVVIYPEFPDDGGVDSERTYMRGYCQKFLSDIDGKTNYKSFSLLPKK